MKNVLFLIDNLNQGGGAQRVFLIFARHCHSKGILSSVNTFTSQNSFVEESQNLKISRIFKFLPNHKISAVFAPFALAFKVRKEKQRVVFSTCLLSNLINIFTSKILLSKHKIIIRETNTLSVRARNFGLRGRLTFLLAKCLYPYADVLIAPSLGVQKDLVENININPEKIRIIYNPIDIEFINKKTSEECNDAFLKLNSKKMFMSIGRLSYAKGFDVLLDAFKMYLQKEGEAVLVILGEGECRSELEAKVKNLKLEEFVHMPGFVENPFCYLKKADVFVLSSRWEGLPNVLIQALACGVTPVSTRCPSGPDEILNHGEFGYLVDVESIQALQQGMLKAINNPMEKKTLKDSVQRYDVKYVMKEFDEILEKLL